MKLVEFRSKFAKLRKDLILTIEVYLEFLEEKSRLPIHFKYNEEVYTLFTGFVRDDSDDIIHYEDLETRELLSILERLEKEV